MSSRSIFRLFTFYTAFVTLCWAQHSGIVVDHAMVNELPPGITVTAGYLEIENRTGAVLTLESVNSPDFGQVEIHQSVIREGIATMSRQDSLDIPAGTRLRFAPGGYHLMLFNPTRELHTGDNVTLVFNFASQSPVSISAPVVRPGHMHEQHH